MRSLKSDGIIRYNYILYIMFSLGPGCRDPNTTSATPQQPEGQLQDMQADHLQCL